MTPIAGSGRRCVPACPHVCSTDAGTPFNPHGNAPNEIARMVEWGMGPLEALVAATAQRRGAACGYPTSARSPPASSPTSSLYDADPLEDIAALRSPRAVWKGGVRV